MTDPVAKELLASRIPARLAYIGPDGAPRVVPIGFWWNGDAFVLATATIAPKVAALRANPKVALTIDTEGFPPRALLVRGTAALDVVEGIPPEYLEAAHKVVEPDQWDEWEAGVRTLYKSMARIVVTPQWAKVLDFETRLPDPVRRLVAEQGAA